MYNQTWYRGEHGSVPNYSSLVGLPTFTNNLEVAKIYAVHPNVSNMSVEQPRVHHAKLAFNNPAVLTDEEDPFTEFAVLARHIGHADAKRAFISLEEHLNNTDNYHSVLREKKYSDIHDFVDNDFKLLYVDFYAVADSNLVQDAIRSNGYDAIIGHGVFAGELDERTTLEARVFQRDQIHTIFTERLSSPEFKRADEPEIHP